MVWVDYFNMAITFNIASCNWTWALHIERYSGVVAAFHNNSHAFEVEEDFHHILLNTLN